MSKEFITPEVLARSEYVIEASGVVDLICPPRQPGQRGRKGLARTNAFLFCLGVRLCTALGHETTIDGVHNVLTRFLTREDQWRLGVLRRAVTTSETPTEPGTEPDWYTPVYGPGGKRRKIRWGNFEQIGYDDLCHVVSRFRDLYDYGPGTAPDLTPAEREVRAEGIAAIAAALLAPTLIPRPDNGIYYAIDATGRWSWSRGSAKIKRRLEEKAKNHNEETDGPLEVGDIAFDDDGATAPGEQGAAPAHAKGRCLDAAWGYRTTKDGQKGPGYGFHQHTIIRTPHPDAGSDSEPHLIEWFENTPANADVVDASLRGVDHIQARQVMKVLLGDSLYTHLRGERWSVPLLKRGVEQVLFMHSAHNAIVPIQGGLLQHRWLHCPSAPLSDRPLPPDRASEEEWEKICDDVELFQANWAMIRKESGLGATLTTKWMCQAEAGKGGCPARGKANIERARRLNLPMITPPEDWQTRPCCTKKTVDFTPDPTDHNHQVKLAQREYYGSRRWRRKAKRRAMVEGVFGILKNPSRQRMTRGQNRIAGLATSTLIAAITHSIYNEEQLRAWHQRTGLGPADHPLLQPDQQYYGHKYLEPGEAAEIDKIWMTKLTDDDLAA